MRTASGLHPLFAACVSGIDIGQRLSLEDAAWVRDALDCWSVLVFSRPDLTDEQHRATPFASTTERRHMVRTTTSCPSATH